VEAFCRIESRSLLTSLDRSALLALKLRAHVGLGLWGQLAGVGLEILVEGRDIFVQLIDLRDPGLVARFHGGGSGLDLGGLEHSLLQADDRHLGLGETGGSKQEKRTAGHQRPERHT